MVACVRQGARFPLGMRIILAALVLGLSVTTMQAQHSPVAEEHALKVGMPAPAFVLNDQDGKKRSLEEFTKQGLVALVFYRSADW